MRLQLPTCGREPIPVPVFALLLGLGVVRQLLPPLRLPTMHQIMGGRTVFLRTIFYHNNNSSNNNYHHHYYYHYQHYTPCHAYHSRRNYW